jgi:quercetin dioxygenase-like cupin family protein
MRIHPVVRNRGDVESHWVLHQLIGVIVDGSATHGRYSLVEAHLPVGCQTPLHVDLDASQVVHVLEGEPTIWVGDQARSLTAGETLLAPANVPRTVKNGGPQPVCLLLLCIPAGFELFVRAAGNFAELGPTRAPAPAEMERTAQLAREYGIELLGPPGMLPSELPSALRADQRAAI